MKTVLSDILLQLCRPKKEQLKEKER